MTDRISFKCDSGDGTTGHVRLRDNFAPQAPVSIALGNEDGSTRSLFLRKADALALHAALADWLGRRAPKPAPSPTVADLLEGLGDFDAARFVEGYATAEGKVARLRSHAEDMQKASDAIWQFLWNETPGGSKLWNPVADSLEKFAAQAREEAAKLEREAAKPKVTPLKDWLADKPTGTFFRYRTGTFSEEYFGVKTGASTFSYLADRVWREVDIGASHAHREFIREVTDLSEIAAAYR
jgi:hypothetical protein